jgi:hypothetical protein
VYEWVGEWRGDIANIGGYACQRDGTAAVGRVLPRVIVSVSVSLSDGTSKRRSELVTVVRKMLSSEFGVPRKVVR